MSKEPCPLCDSRKIEDLYQRTVSSAYSVCISKCEQCGMIHTNPALSPSETNDFVFNEYYKNKRNHNEFSKGLLNRLKTRGKKHAQYICQFFPEQFTGKVLDVGCAMGFFLHQMKLRGWSTKGIEPDASCIEYATREHRLDVERNSFYKLESDKSYDLIYFSHVFDDLYDINSVIIKIKSLLKPKGKVFIEVPNGHRNMQGDLIPSEDLIETCYFFTPTTLTKLFEKHDFSIEKLRTFEPIPCSTMKERLLYPFTYWKKFLDPDKRILIQIITSPNN